MEDNKNIKYNLYRLKSIIIQNKYNKNIKEYEKDNNIIIYNVFLIYLYSKDVLFLIQYIW